MRVLSSDERLQLSRRALFGGAAALAAAPRLARAATPTAINGVVIGKSGWLFATWDVLHPVVPRLVTNVTSVMNEAIGVLKSKGITTAVTLLPSRSRLYGEFLPDGLVLKPEVVGRYNQALRELRAPGTLCRTWPPPWQTRAGPSRRCRSSSRPIPTGCLRALRPRPWPSPRT
jgi:hypothetical protein